MNILILFSDGNGEQHQHIIVDAPENTDASSFDIDGILEGRDYNAAGGTYIVVLDDINRPTVLDANGDEVGATFA